MEEWPSFLFPPPPKKKQDVSSLTAVTAQNLNNVQCVIMAMNRTATSLWDFNTPCWLNNIDDEDNNDDDVDVYTDDVDKND